MLAFTLPKTESHCVKCSRPLDGKHDSPYLPWSVPVNGNLCMMCCERSRGRTVKQMRRECPAESVKALNAYLATKK